MIDPDRDAANPERLSGGEGLRVNWTAVAVVVVLVAGAIVLARAAHRDPPHHAADHRPNVVPAPALPSTGPQVHLGSVFLERLMRCTRTDHQHMLSLGLGVTNLGSRSLVLVGASGITSDAVLVQPVGSRIGTAGCGQSAPEQSVHLDPGGAAVVTVAFRVGAACPRRAFVSARVSFDGGRAGIVHADYSELPVDRFDFVQCA